MVADRFASYHRHADDEIVVDEPLVDGMLLSVTVRRDFVVADAERFLRGQNIKIATWGAGSPP